MNVQNAIDFLIQYLRDSGFEGDIENGTALYDLLIKPLAVLYAIFKNEADKVHGYLSLAKAAEYKSLLGSEYDTAIDSILSNWFVTRGIGEATTGTVRVFFSALLSSIYIDRDTTFTINGVTFIPTEYKLYVNNDGDFKTVNNTIRNAVEYYIDIPVMSTVSTSTTITRATSVTGTVNNLFYLRSEVVSNFTSGSDPESSEAFINRTQEVITTRELVSEKAIKTVLNNMFPSITRIYVAGCGTSEQIRDIVLINSVFLHTGNKIDVYVQSELTKKTLDITGDTSIELNFVHLISVVNNDTGEDITNYEIIDNTLLMSGYDNATVTYLHSPYIALAKEYITNSVACCDIQLTPMVVLPLNIDITVVKHYVDIDENTVKKFIAEYVNNIVDPKDYSMLNMVNYIKNNYSDVYDIELPVTVTLYDNPFNVSLTANITQLYTDDSYITVTIT